MLLKHKTIFQIIISRQRSYTCSNFSTSVTGSLQIKGLVSAQVLVAKFQYILNNYNENELYDLKEDTLNNIYGDIDNSNKFQKSCCNHSSLTTTYF